jgi:flavin-dependent dehydrogenase
MLLPGERLLAVFMTSPPLAAREAGPLARYWADQMARTQHVRRRATGFVLEGDVCVKPASTCACHPVAGERWLAVGDAAIAFDPLSSMGISKALRMGLATADVIQRYLAGDTDAVERYTAAVDQEFNEYLTTRSYYYRQETRWPDRAFWHQRQRTHGDR